MKRLLGYRPLVTRCTPWVFACLLLVIGAASTTEQHSTGDQTVLNEDVEILHFERMMYPVVARAAHAEGSVVLRARLNARGSVSEVTPVSGPKALLADTEKNLGKWTFARPRGGTVVVVYWFRFRGVCELPCPSSFEFYPPNLVVVTTGTAIATP